METIPLDLEPIADTPVKEAGVDEAVLRTAFGKRNRILLRPPSARTLDGRIDGLPAREVASEREQGFEFVAVEVGLSFRPDLGCQFVATDLSLRFSGGPGTSDDRPVVRYLRPREQVRELSFSERREREGELSTKISPGFGELLAKLTDASAVQLEGNLRVRDAYAFGVGYVEAGWRYTASIGHELTGDREGLLVVRRRTDAPLQAEVKLGAEIAVTAALDRWVTVAFGLASQRGAVAQVFELLPA